MTGRHWLWWLMAAITINVIVWPATPAMSNWESRTNGGGDVNSLVP